MFDVDLTLFSPQILNKTFGEVLAAMKMPDQPVLLNVGETEDGTPYTIFVAKGALGKAYEATLGPLLKVGKP
jgi:predicted membrane GTPase involved in stress response